MTEVATRIEELQHRKYEARKQAFYRAPILASDVVGGQQPTAEEVTPRKNPAQESAHFMTSSITYL